MITEKQRRLLDALVTQAALKLDTIFGMAERPEEGKGACSTYSRILAEVLSEFGIKAVVRSVFIITANRAAINYRQGLISEEVAKRLRAKIQYWGDIRGGQAYQHAVCYIPEWDVTIDLAMTVRGSRLVPSHPYWAEDKKFPWWLQQFAFMTYPLEYRAYETEPEKVKMGKEIIREIVRRYL